MTALAEKSGAPLTEVRDAALIFLYRLLFVLYAEDRGLLPVNDMRYADYGLRKRVRDDIAEKTAASHTFSDMATGYYDRLASLFRQIDQGDQSIGLPPYNGGLFSAEAAPLLETTRLADSVVGADRPRPQPHQRGPVQWDGCREVGGQAAIRQLPRHVRTATWLDIRAVDGAGTGSRE